MSAWLLVFALLIFLTDALPEVPPTPIETAVVMPRARPQLDLLTYKSTKKARPKMPLLIVPAYYLRK